MQYLDTMLLDLVISKSKLPKSLNSLSDLSPKCALYRYLKAMENDVKVGRMKKQLGKWLLENRGKDKNFTYGLTGKDSQQIFHGFKNLIKAMQGDSTDPKLLMHLLPIVFIGTNLRECAILLKKIFQNFLSCAMVILLQLLCLILHDQYQALYGALDI